MHLPLRLVHAVLDAIESVPPVDAEGSHRRDHRAAESDPGVTTVTVQIVQLLTGDQEFDSVKTLAAFALGLALFLITLLLNLIALHVVRRYREQYE